MIMCGPLTFLCEIYLKKQIHTLCGIDPNCPNCSNRLALEVHRKVRDMFDNRLKVFQINKI